MQAHVMVGNIVRETHKAVLVDWGFGERWIPKAWLIQYKGRSFVNARYARGRLFDPDDWKLKDPQLAKLAEQNPAAAEAFIAQFLAQFPHLIEQDLGVMVFDDQERAREYAKKLYNLDAETDIVLEKDPRGYRAKAYRVVQHI